MKYTVDYFIEKFEAIPEELWCIGTFQIGEKCCAFGHCGGTEHIGANTVECNELIKVLTVVAETNDGTNKLYQQPTPKQRILAALNDKKINK